MIIKYQNDNKLAEVDDNRCYRGLSQKDRGWHVYIKVNKTSKFVGSFQDKLLAAIIFDIISIPLRGPDGVTNFNLRLVDFLAILMVGNLLDFNMISNMK